MSWTNPRTGRKAPIANVNEDGKIRTSKTLLRFLKDGQTELIDNSPYLWNVDTKRLVIKDVYLTQAGKLRSRHDGTYTVDGSVLAKVQPKGPATLASEKYWKRSDYERPKETEQDRIGSNLAEKVKELKANRIEIEGNPAGMIEKLKQIYRPHVSYITIDDKYRAGGFLRAVDKEGRFITLAQPRKGLTFPVQLKDVKAMYVQAFKHKLQPPKATDMAPTKYPVNVDDVTVFYAKDKYKQTRYMATEKFKALVKKYGS